ncbi:DNA polymerase III subunit gamma/tau [Paenibacillus thalictri]|uniref:DNA-directed DNA polymerase n=1 Tax=Paenibacillus thalictri TaxID=2527873 RepID=A0A4Q9DHS5_9BACL|nr:DNA polymerase III subunit gamma/tau [Paenibacillus thalictri]TBL72616.1 DNA polymerase III subunit gamma/tau [Paenibacillus thalictri]
MAHIALYRTWRPQAFQDVVGQKHIIQTLQNSLREGRISHAYLFNGPRGTGKTTLAKIMAKAVNCLRGPAIEPCNQCAACERITEGSVMDVLEIDAASNRGVEEIRDIRDKVKYAPTEVRHKVYIIDEVHMLTTEAFNALLKTLEEPPEHVMFILATTEPHRLPATIISRCQRFDFRRVPLDEQVERLEEVCRHEEIEAEGEALRYIARLSDGGMRDALSLLDQVIAFSGKKVTYADTLSMTGGIASDQFEALAQAIGRQDVAAALQMIDEFMQEGKSADKCLENLIHFFRDLLLVKMVPGSQAVTERVLDVEQMKRVAAGFANSEMMRFIEVLNHYHIEMKYSAQPQTLFEIAMMKLCRSEAGAQPEEGHAGGAKTDDSVVRDLLGRIGRLEEQLAQLQKQPPSAGPSAPSPSAPFRQASPSSAAATRRSGEKLDGFLSGKDGTAIRAVLGKWSQVLSRVKDQKITVHAWLVDGEPAAIAGDRLLVVFKSAMHRETTERPANKQLIEQVLAEIMGEPYKLSTAMQKDWKAAADQVKEPDTPREELKLVHEEEQKPQEEAYISEAIQWFGEDLVKIKDE